MSHSIDYFPITLKRPTSGNLIFFVTFKYSSAKVVLFTELRNMATDSAFDILSRFGFLQIFLTEDCKETNFLATLKPLHVHFIGIDHAIII